MSLSGLASLGKVPISNVGDPDASSDDVELLGRLVSNAEQLFCPMKLFLGLRTK